MKNLMKKLEGYRTWIGIGSMIIASTNLTAFIAPDQFEQAGNALFVILGVVLSVYGNIKSHKRINELGGY